MNSRTVIFLFVISIFSLNAQTLCGYDDLITSNNAEDTNKTNDFEKKIKERINLLKTSDTVVDTFDLVFHVVHRGEPLGVGVNITDEQIESAVLSLNRDFGAWPIHDSIAIAPNGVNSQIYFRLACVDPNGNFTNGINRVNGNVVPSYAQEGFHFQQGNTGNNMALTSLSDWPINRYINIWITHKIITPTGLQVAGGAMSINSGFFIQGVAGVYLVSQYVGCDVDSSNGFNLFNPYGKTISHEIGHYFGLLHTFEGETCNEINCEIDGDKVCDTEPHSNSVPYDEPCNEYIECGTREPVENLMNYSGRFCGNIFTQGQKDRMKAIIANYFISLINNGNCELPTSVDNEINTPTLTGFVFYPNPSSGIFNLDVKGNNNYTTTVYNILGQSVLTNVNNRLVDLRTFPSGVYFLSIKTMGQTFIKKIIKTN
jgi:hypothetical protein